MEGGRVQRLSLYIQVMLLEGFEIEDEESGWMIYVRIELSEWRKEGGQCGTIID